MGCVDRMSREFQWESLDADGKNELGCNDWKVSFGHDNSRCLKSFKVNMAWRVFFFLAVLSIQIYSWYVDWNILRYYYIYLTHWTLTLQLIFTMFNIAVSYYSLDDALDPAVFPWFVKVIWILSEVLLPSTFLVFALYWGLVWTGPEVKVVSVLTHGVNFLLQATDMTFSSQPKFLLHGIYPFLYSMIYLLWTVIHWALFLDNQNGNPYIYSSLNWWADGTGSLAALIVFFVMPILNFLFWVTVNCTNQVSAGKVTPADAPEAEEAPVVAEPAAGQAPAEEAPAEVPAPAAAEPAEELSPV